MKKTLVLTAILAALMLVLTGCFCQHEWAAADCVNPSTCTLCGKQEGAALGHTWLAANCTDPKTCEVCSATEGEAKGHTWEEATCLLPKKCSTCHALEGEALGHNWEEATTEAPKTCVNCQTTEGSKLLVDQRFTTAATKHLHGKWACDVVLPGELLGTTGYIDELPCTLTYTFGKDGSLACNVELHDYLAFIADMKKIITDVTYDELAYQGIGKSQANDAMMAAYGMTVEQYVDAYVESMDMDEIFGSFAADYVYYVVDDEIFISASWYNTFESSKYTLENGVLIIESDVLEEGGDPLQWTRAEEQQ